MTLTIEISPETQAQIERAAAESQTDVRAFIVEAAAEKAARSAKPNAAARRQLDALDDLLSLGARLTAGTLPLSDDAVARSYADYHDEKEAA